jgi:hypothetical protein
MCQTRHIALVSVNILGHTEVAQNDSSLLLLVNLNKSIIVFAEWSADRMKLNAAISREIS